MHFSDARVLVIGDAMLDVYCEGSVARVSPEAPVPVVLMANERMVPGGAANVAANIASLGAAADLIAVLGRDSGARDLADLMRAQFPRVGLDHLVQSDTRSTTTKTRVIGNKYQVVRLDREQSGFLDAATENAVLAKIEARLPFCSVVILSDYLKGVCSDRVIRGAIALARAAGKRILVDPKRSDFSIYEGADYLKPNAKELGAATGMPCGTDGEIAAAARRITALTGASVIVTRSERGMSFVPPEGDPIHIPTVARSVFDVSGAGDTVMAALALGLQGREPMAHVLAVANAAAAVVVGKAGTATVTPEEIDEEMRARRTRRSAARSKVVAREEARRAVAQWRAEGRIIGFANGCFDLLHPGHIDLLEQAAEQCDRLVVALNTDASVRRLKGESRPVQDEHARATVMAALGMVDLVVLFDEDTPKALIEALLPDVLVKGADYTVETVVGADIVQANGGRVYLATLVPDMSTSALVRRMRG
ncbi:D-glycero-beta-D-manno-heptose 1-phosphate adenylyltransferase [Aquabacter spiritensis]|nr:D-glycero-beta-D-manno-heptose 1-phosphate adenylyltransferase [Aquabacter spiritensis]